MSQKIGPSDFRQFEEGATILRIEDWGTHPPEQVTGVYEGYDVSVGSGEDFEAIKLSVGPGEKVTLAFADMRNVRRMSLLELVKEAQKRL